MLQLFNEERECYGDADGIDEEDMVERESRSRTPIWDWAIAFQAFQNIMNPKGKRETLTIVLTPSIWSGRRVVLILEYPCL